MSTGAIVFLVISWSLVLGLMLWSFTVILRHRKHLDPDGIGPAAPPEGGRVQEREHRHGAV